MIIRPATLADKGAIIAIAMHQTLRYPKLKPDVKELTQLANEAISSAKHFAWVAEDEDKKVRGVLVGLTGGNLWAQRQNCNITLWASSLPGGGAALLRKFKEWVLSRRAIKVAGMCPDLDLDKRILHLTERIGFTRHGGAYLLYN